MIGRMQHYKRVVSSLVRDARIRAPYDHALDLCVDALMDVYDEQSKLKIVGWVGNLVLKERCAQPKTFNREGGRFPQTYGPSDLFLNINTAFEAAVHAHKLTGRALARVASIYGHVLNYYVATLSIHCCESMELRAGQLKTVHELQQDRKAKGSEVRGYGSSGGSVGPCGLETARCGSGNHDSIAAGNTGSSDGIVTGVGGNGSCGDAAGDSRLANNR